MRNITRLVMSLVVIIACLAPVSAQTLYDEATAASVGLGPDLPADVKTALGTALRGEPAAPSVLALIAANNRALALLHEAASSPAVDFNPSRRSVLERPLLNFAVLIDLCALTTTRAGQRASSGDTGGALTDFRTVLHCSRHMINDPLLIFKMVGTGIVNDTLPTLQAHHTLPGLREVIAGCPLPSARAMVEDEKKHFIESVELAATDSGPLGNLLVRHAPAIADRYYDVLARQVDGDKTADGPAAVATLRASLEKAYGTTIIGLLIEKMNHAVDLTDDEKAEVIDGALLLEVFPSIDRPLLMYGKMRAALEGVYESCP